MKVSTWIEPAFGGMHFLFYKEGIEGKHYIVKPIEMFLEPRIEGTLMEPTLKMNDLEAREFLQSMVDQAEKLGIKSSKKPVLENELEAVKYHLEDMRTLVFKLGAI